MLKELLKARGIDTSTVKGDSKVELFRLLLKDGIRKYTEQQKKASSEDKDNKETSEKVDNNN